MWIDVATVVAVAVVSATYTAVSAAAALSIVVGERRNG